MARGRGLLLAGLAAGAYAYFKNPENREKATKAFNEAKVKVNSYMESQNLDKDGNPISKTTDTPSTTEKRENKWSLKAELPQVSSITTSSNRRNRTKRRMT